MSMLIPPHGNAALKPLLLPPEEREDALKRARALRKLPLSSREVSDLFMLAMGAYSPLEGFMGAADWRGACVDMRLENGLFWPLPITLSCGEDFAAAVGDEVALTDAEGEILGILAVAETYAIDKGLECREVYRTTDEAHPGVAKVMAQGAVNLAGPGLRPVGRPLSRDLSRALLSPRRDPGAVRRKGLVDGRRLSRPATPCTAATSFSPRSPSRCATAC